MRSTVTESLVQDCSNVTTVSFVCLLTICVMVSVIVRTMMMKFYVTRKSPSVHINAIVLFMPFIVSMLTKSKFPPRNMRNNFFLSMWGKFFFAPVYYGQSYALVPKSFGFLSFWGNSGPLSGRKLTFFTTVLALLTS